MCIRDRYLCSTGSGKSFAAKRELLNVFLTIPQDRIIVVCLLYTSKHSVENPVEKQAIFPNHHEPIIYTETWERVQELRKQRKRPNRYDEVGLFSGMPVSYTHLDVYKRQEKGQSIFSAVPCG